MPLIGGKLGYRLLKFWAPGGDRVTLRDSIAYDGRNKLEVMLGARILRDVAGKVVVDFGCGPGEEAIELARRGAERVIGVDIQERFLEMGRKRAQAEGLQEQVSFVSSLSESADVVISIDAFEHFSDPAAILRIVAGLLKESGRFYASFGPTWYHPLGGHLFSVFPWSHLLFSESALIRWRSDFKNDGATRFHEVAGGLNQMTIQRFEDLVAASPLEFEHFEAVPIRRLARLHCRMNREFTTAIVRATLRHRS